MPKQRLDTLLADRGLYPSRSRAAASVMAGEVCVGEGRRRAEKPGELVDIEAPVSVDRPPAFVSRGGIKLANALAASGLPVQGRVALDIEYIERQSFWLDLYIMAMTLPCLLGDRQGVR